MAVSSMDALRVLTTNCWNVSPPFEPRSELLRAEIERLQPDVIGLQEIIVRADGLDMAQMILDGLGYEWVYGSAQMWGEDGKPQPGAGAATGFGNAVASRYPIVRSCVEQLPDAGSGEYRSATMTIIDAPCGPLLFATTHLNWKFHHGFVREQQVLALAELIERWRSEVYLPPILVGDLNADPDSAEVRFLCGMQSLNGRSCFFEDAWRVGGGSGPGFTWDNKNPFAAMVSEPNRRLDYILVGLPYENGRGRIEDCRLAMADAHNGIYPTDHFGLFAELRV
ncbi:MAG TPA: endonuclease/exonuclease/phosphatase family protein [Terriglobales bacterium]|nr:endonuclease/exonuclease/phosphatase family protein [Terriglobales bacterium]